MSENEALREQVVDAVLADFQRDDWDLKSVADAAIAAVRAYDEANPEPPPWWLLELVRCVHAHSTWRVDDPTLMRGTLNHVPHRIRVSAGLDE